MPTVEELGAKVRAKYPGDYDDLDDATLGQKVKAKFPGAYDDFTDGVGAVRDAVSPTEPPPTLMSSHAPTAMPFQPLPTDRVSRFQAPRPPGPTLPEGAGPFHGVTQRLDEATAGAPSGVRLLANAAGSVLEGATSPESLAWLPGAAVGGAAGLGPAIAGAFTGQMANELVMQQAPQVVEDIRRGDYDAATRDAGAALGTGLMGAAAFGGGMHEPGMEMREGEPVTTGRLWTGSDRVRRMDPEGWYQGQRYGAPVPPEGSVPSDWQPEPEPYAPRGAPGPGTSPQEARYPPPPPDPLEAFLREEPATGVDTRQPWEQQRDRFYEAQRGQQEQAEPQQAAEPQSPLEPPQPAPQPVQRPPARPREPLDDLTADAWRITDQLADERDMAEQRRAEAARVQAEIERGPSALDEFLGTEARLPEPPPEPPVPSPPPGPRRLTPRETEDVFGLEMEPEVARGSETAPQPAEPVAPETAVEDLVSGRRGIDETVASLGGTPVVPEPPRRTPKKSGGRFKGKKPAPAPVAPTAPPTLADFATAVNTAASRVEEGPDTTGPRKVFISRVYQDLRSDPAWAGLSRDDFNQRLLDARREGLVELARSDLKWAANPENLTASEIVQDLGHGITSSVHYVLRERFKKPRAVTPPEEAQAEDLARSHGPWTKKRGGKAQPTGKAWPGQLERINELEHRMDELRPHVPSDAMAAMEFDRTRKMRDRQMLRTGMPDQISPEELKRALAEEEAIRDGENAPGLQGDVGVRQEPQPAEPLARAGGEEAGTGRVFSRPPEVEPAEQAERRTVQEPAVTPERGATPPREAVLSSLEQANPDAWRGSLVPIAEMRRASGLNPAEFDAAVLDLAREGRIQLQSHDDPRALTPEQRARLIPDSRGSYYVAAGLRMEGEGSAGNVAEKARRMRVEAGEPARVAPQEPAEPAPVRVDWRALQPARDWSGRDRIRAQDERLGKQIQEARDEEQAVRSRLSGTPKRMRRAVDDLMKERGRIYKKISELEREKDAHRDRLWEIRLQELAQNESAPEFSRLAAAAAMKDQTHEFRDTALNRMEQIVAVDMARAGMDAKEIKSRARGMAIDAVNYPLIQNGAAADHVRQIELQMKHMEAERKAQEIADAKKRDQEKKETEDRRLESERVRTLGERLRRQVTAPTEAERLAGQIKRFLPKDKELKIYPPGEEPGTGGDYFGKGLPKRLTDALDAATPAVRYEAAQIAGVEPGAHEPFLLPYEPQKKLVTLREAGDGVHLFKGTLGGREAWTNGHFIEFGTPPKGEPPSLGGWKDFPSSSEKIVADAQKGKPRELTPVAIEPRRDSDVLHMRRSDGEVIAMSRLYYEHFATRYPGGKLVQYGKAEGPTVYLGKDGKIAGVIMPMKGGMVDVEHLKTLDAPAPSPGPPPPGATGKPVVGGPDRVADLRAQIKERESKETRFAGGVDPGKPPESVGAAAAGAATGKPSLWDRLRGARQAFAESGATDAEQRIRKAERNNWVGTNMSFIASVNPDIAEALARSSQRENIAKVDAGHLIQEIDKLYERPNVGTSTLVGGRGAEQFVATLTEQTLRNMEKGYRTWAEGALEEPPERVADYFDSMKERILAGAKVLRGTREHPGSRADVGELIETLMEQAEKGIKIDEHGNVDVEAAREPLAEASRLMAENTGRIELPDNALIDPAYIASRDLYRKWAEPYDKLAREIDVPNLPPEFTSEDVPYFPLTAAIEDIPSPGVSRFWKKPLARPKTSRHFMRTGVAEAYDTSLDALRKNMASFVGRGEYGRAVKLMFESGLAEKVKPGKKAPATMESVKGYEGHQFETRALPRASLPSANMTLAGVLPKEALAELDRLYEPPKGEAGPVARAMGVPTAQSLIGLMDNVAVSAQSAAVALGQNPKGFGKLLLSPLVKAWRAGSDPTAFENQGLVRDMVGDGAFGEGRFGEHTLSREKARAFGSHYAGETTHLGWWHAIQATFDGPSGLMPRLRLIARAGLKEAHPELYADWRERIALDKRMAVYGKMVMSKLEHQVKGLFYGIASPFVSRGMARFRNVPGMLGKTPKGAHQLAWPIVNFVGASVAQWMLTHRLMTGRWPEPGKDTLYRIKPDDKDKDSMLYRVGNAMGWSPGGALGKTAANLAGISEVWNRWGEDWPTMLGNAISKSTETLSRPFVGGPLEATVLYGTGKKLPFMTYDKKGKRFNLAEDWDRKFDNPAQRWLYALTALHLGRGAEVVGEKLHLWPKQGEGRAQSRPSRFAKGH